MPYAIDLFCGAGGFSEGIIQAGFHIIFSSDRSEFVMKTYMNRHEQLGLVQGYNTHFELADIRELNGEKIFDKINRLDIFLDNNIEVGQIDAIFGGPPCQGFSRAGKRDPNDPRNMLFHEYVRVIADIMPRYVVVENVEGFMDTQLENFRSMQEGYVYEGAHLVSEILQSELRYIGYNTLAPRVLDASNYGVPQRRRRAIFIAYRNGEAAPEYPEPITFEENQKITVRQAIGDLLLSEQRQYTSEYIVDSKRGRTPSMINNEPIARIDRPLNHEISTHAREIVERFSLFNQGESAKNVENRILREGVDLMQYPTLLKECVFNANINSNLEELRECARRWNIQVIDQEAQDRERWLRATLKLIQNILDTIRREELENGRSLIKKLANRLETTERIARSMCIECMDTFNREIPENVIVERFTAVGTSDGLIKSLLTKKNSRTRLDEEDISPTMVTLPDDYIHPSEHRILTVREMARMQSFDDSFEFIGKRTTGGKSRTQEVPQYTQVGNAVPPLLARAIATQIIRAIEQGD